MPTARAPEVLGVLEKEGRVVRVAPDLWFGARGRRRGAVAAAASTARARRDHGGASSAT